MWSEGESNHSLGDELFNGSRSICFPINLPGTRSFNRIFAVSISPSLLSMSLSTLHPPRKDSFIHCRGQDEDCSARQQKQYTIVQVTIRCDMTRTMATRMRCGGGGGGRASSRYSTRTLFRPLCCRHKLLWGCIPFGIAPNCSSSSGFVSIGFHYTYYYPHSRPQPGS